jgi:hypothetical protein
MTTHELKSWPDYFVFLLDGTKTFELRINDRHFQVGDILHIREYDDRTGKYTGRDLRKRVTYILEGVGGGGIAPLCGLFRTHVIMSLVDA